MTKNNPTLIEILKERNPHCKKLGLYQCNYKGCKNEFIAIISAVKNGTTQSCGCLRVETTSKLARTHGKSKLLEYKCWKNLKQRCYNKNNPKYPSHGARGISVCDRWKNSFENFLEDMGLRPIDKKSVDRIDNGGNYEPGNCRWADPKQQSNNQRVNLPLVEYNGEMHSIEDWNRKLNFSNRLLYTRLIKLGWSMDKAVNTPIKV